jgi:hypothetical protein
MLFPHCVGFFPVYLKKSAETLLAFLLKETSLSHAFYVNNQFQRKFLFLKMHPGFFLALRIL